MLSFRQCLFFIAILLFANSLFYRITPPRNWLSSCTLCACSLMARVHSSDLFSSAWKRFTFHFSQCTVLFVLSFFFPYILVVMIFLCTKLCDKIVFGVFFFCSSNWGNFNKNRFTSKDLFVINPQPKIKQIETNSQRMAISMFPAFYLFRSFSRTKCSKTESQKDKQFRKSANICAVVGNWV